MNFLHNPEFCQFVLIQTNLEKTIRAIIEHYSHNSADNIKLQKFDEEREYYTKNVKALIQNTLKCLSDKKNIFKQNKALCVTDYNQFKKEMITIQENIYNIKCSANIELKELFEKENKIEEDLLYYNSKLLDWNQPIKQYNINEVKIAKTKYHRKSHSCKEVKNFLDFIHVSGGHENGWRKEDHQLFVKLFTKYKNNDLAVNLHELLPDIGIEQIRAHEDWYRRYIFLQNQKKKAVEKWKGDRLNQRTTKPTLINPCFQEKIQLEEGIQEKLTKWKTEKEEKLRILNEELRLKEMKEKQIEDKKRKRQDEIKAIVVKWRQMNVLMEETKKKQQLIKEGEEKKKRAVEANMMIKIFQSQDDIYIHKLKELKDKKTEKSQLLRSQSCNTAKRDPLRLFRPTLQWINRVHDDGIKIEGSRGVPYVKNLPKLGVPKWRENLQ